MKKTLIIATLFMVAAYTANCQFQRTPTPNDNLKSVEANVDGSVTFRIYAPQAESVSLSGDIRSIGAETNKLENGVWEIVVPNIVDGAYRYNFVVDGVTVYDPKYPRIADIKPVASISRNQESAFWAQKDVPHGALSQIYYKSTTMGTTRRMHIWTPPGYNASSDKLPVLYLIHGGGDNDAAWPGVGCANWILDNLLANGKMVPMIVVIPDGSISTDLFTDEMMKDIVPYIEKNYMVLTDKDHRAIAGLSMGGLETLNVFMAYPDKFAYINVMSSGWFKDNKEMMDSGDKRLGEISSTLAKNVKLLKFTQGGPEDIAYENCKEMLKLFDKNGIKYQFSEMPGGHTFHVWRHDLYSFAQAIFK